MHGITTHLADNNLQQFVNSKTDRPVIFSYEAFPFEGKQIGVITIPKQKRPIVLRNNYGRLLKQTVYTRRGSSTEVATMAEVGRMVEADTREDWAAREIEAQRIEREQQREFQQAIHNQLYRPEVICTFPVIHTVMYLCLKNYGKMLAKNVSIGINLRVGRGVGGLTHLPACVDHPVPFLAPDEDVHYFMFGPSDYATMPLEIDIKLTYTNLAGKAYSFEQIFDFRYLGIDSGSERRRGLDLARERNDPIVIELSRIADALRESRR